MTAADFSALLRSTGHTSLWLAARLGVSPNTVSRWRKGKIDVPEYAVAYLALWKLKIIYSHAQPID